MPRKTRPVILDFSFFAELWHFYNQNRGLVRRHYRELTRRFLDYNDPANSHSFLRQPQFEALEVYVFLKEYLANRPLHALFEDWAAKSGPFAGRPAAVGARQLGLFEELTREQYDAVFDRMRRGTRVYPNYIFALTMGTGKTILMATCIFYEFILAQKFPTDPAYCHNALVFAPDTTVLQSLKEIMTFDLTLVVPPEYVNFLTTHVQYHFLDQAGTALSTIDRSRFNVIISNTQKVILKRQSQPDSPAVRLFGSGRPTYQPGTPYAEAADLYDEEPGDEGDLITNQRFQKLQRLEQLGIYVDEAHHAFGARLAKDMGVQQSLTSLRTTIDQLAASLTRAGTHVVACFNYTGTPYVGQEVLPEVVYAFGLQAAIAKHYLKHPRIQDYAHTQDAEFIDIVVDDFLKQHRDEHGECRRYEGMLPKLAIFATTIDELQNKLRPAVEKALNKRDIPTDRILVNVGEEKLTSSEDILKFNQLDTPASTKQFILLVGKGREGWNCRSLFGVALFRRPHSRIFVLQATMRCLRSITDAQQTAAIHLSAENRQLLEDELQENFRLSISDITTPGSTHYDVRVKTPVDKIKLARVHHQYDLTEKPVAPGLSLDLHTVDCTPYQLTRTTYDGLAAAAAGAASAVQDLTHLRQRRTFSELTLVAEISRYLHLPCLTVQDLLAQTAESAAGILGYVNEYNELLYDCVIPRLFRALYDLTERVQTEEYEVDLVKIPPEGTYQISAKPALVVHEADASAQEAPKSFHLDPYCFDSDPERDHFWRLLHSRQVTRLYFTGMLTHGQSDFYVQYIDPDSHTLRTYYPDFLLQLVDDSYVIVEVKADHQIIDPVVQAKKDFAQQMAIAAGMTYEIVPASQANRLDYPFLHPTRPRPPTPTQRTLPS